MTLLITLSEIVRNLALALAAGVGAYLAWRKLGPETKQAGTAVAQAELARRAHVTELFNRAAGQLGDAKLEVRLAAIYVLREVSRDFPILPIRCSSCCRLTWKRRMPITGRTSRRSKFARFSKP